MANPLGELVTAHCERTGDTLSAIAERGGLSRQTLSGLVNRDDPQAWPRRSTLAKLAKGLGVSTEYVQQIATSAYGNGDGPPTRRLVSVLMAHAEQLDDDQLEVLLATSRALQKQPERV